MCRKYSRSILFTELLLLEHSSDTFLYEKNTILYKSRYKSPSSGEDADQSNPVRGLTFLICCKCSKSMINQFMHSCYKPSILYGKVPLSMQAAAILGSCKQTATLTNIP